MLLTTAVGEMVIYIPQDSPFLNMGGRVVDSAYEFATSINFFLMQSIYSAFEIVSVCNLLLTFDINRNSPLLPGLPIAAQIVIFGLINLYAVRWFGIAEFWFSIAKVLLAIGLIFFTLITMCGGNPQHDAFGFRNWHVDRIMAEMYTTGALGRFQSFLYVLRNSSSFTCVGPEYLSMVAGETINPRRTLSKAFKSILYRLVVFYIGGALSVTILIAYNDPKYNDIVNNSNSASSPYVVAMQNMGISALPYIVNAVILTSAFSAGSAYVYTSSRCLFNLSKKGFIPRLFSRCNKKGTPYFAVCGTMCITFLSFMQLGKQGQKAFNYLVNLTTSAQILNYGFMSITYIRFYHACIAQKIDRNEFTYKSWFQPYSIYLVCAYYWCLIGILGYQVFMPGKWTVDSFLFSYIMLFISIAAYVFWKLFKRQPFVKLREADLKTGLEEIEEHEYEYEYYAKSETVERSWLRRLQNWIS
ncbi:unnamed protein product [Candida verbasci]|uniref:Amino acid permease/ SLC12A domain-containing protein n=1 Tax=Candida verbasci TaxID=1227364 RepID=A0A9W4XMK9_9ASCO|nr:unnamed protein product [Candida verbasci]